MLPCPLRYQDRNTAHLLIIIVYLNQNPNSSNEHTLLQGMTAGVKLASALQAELVEPTGAGVPAYPLFQRPVLKYL